MFTTLCRHAIERLGRIKRLNGLMVALLHSITLPAPLPESSSVRKPTSLRQTSILDQRKPRSKPEEWSSEHQVFSSQQQWSCSKQHCSCLKQYCSCFEWHRSCLKQHWSCLKQHCSCFASEAPYLTSEVIAVVTNVRTQVSTSANKGLKPLVLR